MLQPTGLLLPARFSGQRTFATRVGILRTKRSYREARRKKKYQPRITRIEDGRSQFHELKIDGAIKEIFFIKRDKLI